MKLMAAIHKYEIDDPMVFPYVDTARDLGIVISIHSGVRNCSADRIDVLAKRVPEAPVIVDHMGYPDNFEDAMQVCRDNPNCRMGTTVLRFHKLWANNPDREFYAVLMPIASDSRGQESYAAARNAALPPID